MKRLAANASVSQARCRIARRACAGGESQSRGPKFRDNAAHSGMISPRMVLCWPTQARSFGACKGGTGCQQRDRLCVRCAKFFDSSSLWRTDPRDRPSHWSGRVDGPGDAQALSGCRPELVAAEEFWPRSAPPADAREERLVICRPKNLHRKATSQGPEATSQPSTQMVNWCSFALKLPVERVGVSGGSGFSLGDRNSLYENWELAQG